MSPHEEEALALFQRNRGETPMTPEAIKRMNFILDEFWGHIPTQEQADRIQSCVTEIFSAPVIYLSDLPSHLSAALSSELT